MPVKRTHEEERELREAALRSRRLVLQKEISDQVRDQQRVYDEAMKPNAPDAKLLASQVRGGTYNGKTLDPEIAKHLIGLDTPTAKFEWARSEIDRISKLVTSKRSALVKVEKELEGVRSERTAPYIERAGFVSTVVADLRSALARVGMVA